jgi:hypothetical protein
MKARAAFALLAAAFAFRAAAQEPAPAADTTHQSNAPAAAEQIAQPPAPKSSSAAHAPEILAPASPDATPGKKSDAPVLSGNSLELAVRSDVAQLLVFKGTSLLNEFVYRAVLTLPSDAQANPPTVRKVIEQLAAFLLSAGYDLAKVRAHVVGQQIEVTVDEGALDKVIVSGGGWITALRFRAALNLPLDVFNRKLFEQQFPELAKRFGFRSYRYELWPVHLLDADNAAALDDIDELRAMPLLHAARGYELRIFGQTEQWSGGFSPEIVLNGPIGIGIGGRYRWKDIFQEGDRWQIHFRFGAALRGAVDPIDGGSSLVNSEDYVSARWLSKPWSGSSSGLRMTITAHEDLWTLQRPDLLLERYRINTIEFGAGAGAQLTREFSLYFTLGVQRRWIFNVDPVQGTTPSKDVTDVPAVANRGFLRATSQYTFNPSEIRQDLRDWVQLDLDAYQPSSAHTRGYFHFDLQGRKIFQLGWHELRVGGRITGEGGDVLYVDEIPLSDHLRIGFGLSKYTKRLGSTSLEFRYSLLRDKVKVGVFTDLGVWRHLPRVDSDERAELAGSSGGGLFFFIFDELQIDAFYGVGWATDHYLQPGFALAIKEAF